MLSQESRWGLSGNDSLSTLAGSKLIPVEASRRSSITFKDAERRIRTGWSNPFDKFSSIAIKSKFRVFQKSSLQRRPKVQLRVALWEFFFFFLSPLFWWPEKITRMRNKTLLIRRHLIHYWHLSNQTTFHKTIFFGRFPRARGRKESSMENMLLGCGGWKRTRRESWEKREKRFQFRKLFRKPATRRTGKSSPESGEKTHRQTHPFTSWDSPSTALLH